RKRLDLLLPSGREPTGSVVLLGQPRRQVSVLRFVVLGNQPDITRLEKTHLSVMVEIVVVTVMLRVFLPVVVVIVPLVGPCRCAEEQRCEGGDNQRFPTLHDLAPFPAILNQRLM